MHIPPILAQCALVSAIACGTAWAWLHLTGSRTLTPGAILACTAVSVALALAVEAAVQRTRRGRPRRAHARPHPSKNRKAA
ncbi:hypothetical protein [Streptomyces sp. NPDC007991]|uniref:hypothetical protein n=1 Tax=Streptomyces sp. NPDC007991 TaxID=3364803 RepID=UPI0036F0749B